MRLDEGMERLRPYIGMRFDTFLNESELSDLRRNKGKVGQTLEKLIGLNNTSNNIDFDDGELKTNKSDIKGNPKETMFITQISTHIDEILADKTFKDTYIYNKIKNLLYVPVCKDGDEASWMFLPFININLELDKYQSLKAQLENDYNSISRQLNDHIRQNTDGFIHTSNGEYIQIRSKDSKPYSAIYSNIYGRDVSNKNHAFYFKKDFMRYIKIFSDDYPL